jgi:DNA-binding protein H-NS
MDERRRDSIVAYLRRRMAEYGIEPQDVAASIADDQRRLRGARYANAFGDTWDGKGDTPQWVLQAMSAGQSLAHFEIREQPAPAPQKRVVDWREDPFSGTRLATNRSANLTAS